MSEARKALVARLLQLPRNVVANMLASLLEAACKSQFMTREELVEFLKDAADDEQ